MHRSGSDSSSSSLEKIFTGVRFVLFGFDSASEAQYRSELVSKEGTDVGRYDSSCTHVIVCDHVYDDPICIAALNDGKTLVTESWIDDSLDFGKLADASRVLYRPVKDLNGIPGSESLYICLTGYQRQERDDIMKMVSLMGAHFSKPLIANQVTHLVCYKFEGEKYELAKKVNIKLVNHRWLEDCLKAWEILPIDNYTRSSWELENLEAEARDSEEETEDPGMRAVGKQSLLDASSLLGGMPISERSDMSIPTLEKLDAQQDTVVATHSLGSEDDFKNFSTPCKETSSAKTLGMCGLSDRALEEFDHQDARVVEPASDNCVMTNTVSGGAVSMPCNDTMKMDTDKFSSHSGIVKRDSLLSDASNEKFSNLSYSRKNPRKLNSEEKLSTILPISPLGKLVENNFKTDFDISQVTLGEARSNQESADIPSPTASAREDHLEASSVLPQKRKNPVSSISVKSPKTESEDSKACAPQSPSSTTRSAELETTTAFPRDTINPDLIDINKCLEGAAISNLKANQQSGPSKFKSLSYRRKSLKSGKPALSTTNSTSTLSCGKKADLPSDACPRQTFLETMRRENNSTLEKRHTVADVSPCDDKVLPDLPLDDEPIPATCALASIRSATNILGTLSIDCRSTEETSPEEKQPGSSFGGSRKCKVNGGDTAMYDMPTVTTEEPGKTWREQQDGGVLSPDSRDSETRKLSSNASADTPKETDVKVASRLHTKKVVSKRYFSSKKLSTGKFTKDKIATSSNKIVIPNQDTVQSRKLGQVIADQKHEKEISDEEAVGPVSKGAVTEDKAEVSQLSIEDNSKNIDMDWTDSSMDSEKENKPNENGSSTVNMNFDRIHKVVPEHGKKSMQSSKSIAADNKNEKKTSSCGRSARSEPAWFILSGHRLQIKECQMVIKRLRGRLCRDSHNWSYQATHLIVPDPVRRTEKFFAAAAAGRWIIKTDYLTASNESRKFLDEEPFEWYRKGLSEDGAISLEAPRKWRRLRERTGHGALYGMRIIIYGDCIAPTLDTLKRVVKAGDGTILATSPPYTRFLKSGVDYAIVSSSTPRVDSWVQEFLRHEIPCVVADYLVEYVCKPGYSLERHVLYKTHDWAEKSFARLLSRSQEIVTDAAVCGS